MRDYGICLEACYGIGLEQALATVSAGTIFVPFMPRGGSDLIPQRDILIPRRVFRSYLADGFVGSLTRASLGWDSPSVGGLFSATGSYRGPQGTPDAIGYCVMGRRNSGGFDLPKAAIFDLDGTALDSVDLHALAWQKAMIEFATM
jgi:hypothetical protein